MALKKPGWQISKQELMAQGIRYLAASAQDTHPVFGVTHASYARLIFEAMAYEGDYFPALLRRAGELQEMWTRKIFAKIPMPIDGAATREIEGKVGDARPASKVFSMAERIAILKKMAAGIEKRVAAARDMAKQIGRDVGLMRDTFGRLRMVFVEPIKRAATTKGSLIPPGYKEGRSLSRELTAVELVVGQDPFLKLVESIDNFDRALTGVRPPGIDDIIAARGPDAPLPMSMVGCWPAPGFSQAMHGQLVRPSDFARMPLVMSGAWPRQGFALPVRGYLTRPHGYAATPRTRIIPGG